MFEIRMAPGRSAVRHLAPYAVMSLLGGLLVLFAVASWGIDERAPAALLTGLAFVVLGGRPFLRRLRIVRAAVPTLRWDDQGVEVAYGRLEDVRYARLAWPDCAVVVACRLSRSRDARSQYVAFVPVADDRVAGDTTAPALQPRVRALGVSPAHALMTWLDPFGQKPGVDEVLAEVRRCRPELPVKDLR